MPNSQQKASTRHDEIVDAAHAYHRRMWKPVVLNSDKRPVAADWQHDEIDPGDYDAAFAGTKKNIGIQFGACSDGLTDVDLDCAEALAIADIFLPETASEFGRTSKRRAHRLYYTMLYRSEHNAAIQLKDPMHPKKAVLVELRIGGGGKGAQTAFPPSRHPSGELVAWDVDDDPAEVDDDALKLAVMKLGAASLLARYYPGEGTRQDFALTMGGVLAREGWSEDDAAQFVEAIAVAAGDEEHGKRGSAARDSVKNFADGKQVFGIPKLLELVTHKKVVDKICEWLGLAEALAPQDHDGKSQATILVDIVVREATLFYTNDDTPYAMIEIAGHRENWPIASAGFARWIKRRFYEETNLAPGREAMTTALGVIEAKATHPKESECHDVFTRTARLGERLYLDLCNDKWQAIEIDRDGWHVVDDPPVRFQRRPHMLALPVPVKNTNRNGIELLRGYVNTDDDHFKLIVAWLLDAMRHAKTHTVLLLTGEKGTAKSTLLTLARLLFDPYGTPGDYKLALRAPPESNRDFFIAANNAYGLTFDNLSKIPAWMSDTLCRMATGGGFSTRELYKDDVEKVFGGVRAVALASIDKVAVRGDLVDRSYAIDTKLIGEDERLYEEDLFANFEQDRPHILASLCDALSCGLREWPNTRPNRVPRMADSYRWALACEGALPEQFRGYAEAAEKNREAGSLDVLEADPVAVAIRQLVVEHSFSGTMTELLARLNADRTDDEKHDRAWPKGANALSGHLAELGPELRRVGITITIARDARSRVNRITIAGTNSSQQDRSHRSHRSKCDETGFFGERSASDGRAMRERSSEGEKSSIDRASSDASDASDPAAKGRVAPRRPWPVPRGMHARARRAYMQADAETRRRADEWHADYDRRRRS